MGIFTKKNFHTVRNSSNSNILQKNLTAFDLVMMGLGAIIGTGVFVLTGMIAATYSGPAVTISYAIAGFVCILVALAYTELASMLPTSGSIYTYSYVAFGELFAWLVGSVIILEFVFGASTVAAGWSGYVQSILSSGGIILPKEYTTIPLEGGIVNLPAVLIVAFISFILFLGTKDSKRLNAILVFIKLGAILAFILVAVPYVDLKNWSNFMPYGTNSIITGSSILFFAFGGFGTLATAAEECKNPKRDLTIGIIFSLILSTLVYVLLAALLTLIAPYNELNNVKPFAYALSLNGNHIGSAIVAVGAVCGMTTVLLMQLYGTSRMFFAIARDNLLPGSFAKLHPKYDTPYVTIFVFSSLTAILAGFCPYQLLGQLSSMGALIDYIVVISIVMLFRYLYPNEARPFKCPGIYFIAPLALASCVYLLFKQILDEHGSLLFTGKAIMIWFVVMFVLYLIRAPFIKRTSASIS